jgi:hypothetical protein
MKVRARRSRFALAFAVLAVAAVVVAPSSASGWKWVFLDFFNASQGSSVAAHAEATKCKGGKLGFYDYVARVVSGDQLEHEVTANLPVFAKFRQLKNVVVTFRGPTWDSLPPDFQAQLLSGTTAFYQGTSTRYVAKKNRLIFRHPALVLFGAQSIPAGDDPTKFKPKDKC